MKVDFFKHTLNDSELKNISKVLKSNILSIGENCKKFEI